jgi:hypothetical protein
MRATLRQPIIIENVAGAARSVGVGRAVWASADGYTLIAGTLTTHVLEPGWMVRDVQSGNAIEVRYEGARICGRDGVIAFAACLGERSTAVSASANGSRAWAGAEAVSRCDKLSTGALLVPAR